jgi:hypothetical protein
MSNQPDQPRQEPTVPMNKLVLPALPEQESHGQTSADLTRPEPRLRRGPSAVSRGFFSLIRSFWHQELAVRILGLATVVVSVASIALVALGANMLLHSTSSHSSQTSSNGQAVIPAPSASVGVLTVQMIDVPNHVVNGTTVQVQARTSKPGVTVNLQVSYQVPPFSSTSGPQTTDVNGLATIDWPVNISSFGHKTSATVVVVATDQSGRQIMSSPVTVTITNNQHPGHDSGDNNN